MTMMDERWKRFHLSSIKYIRKQKKKKKKKKEEEEEENFKK